MTMTTKELRNTPMSEDPVAPENDRFPLSWLICRVRGIGKMKLIAESGISPASIAAWDRGDRLPRPKLLEKMLIGTAIDPEAVVTRQRRIFPGIVMRKPRGKNKPVGITVEEAKVIAQEEFDRMIKGGQPSAVVSDPAPRAKEEIEQTAGIPFATREAGVDDWEEV